MLNTITTIITCLTGSLLCAYLIDYFIVKYKQHKAFKSWEETCAKQEVDDTPTPIPPQQQGYDVNAFQRRMEQFKKEYYEDMPMYDMPETPLPSSDSTGVEVMTEELEKAIDRKAR